jgi:quinol monooxygenase YgiN
MSRMRFWLPLLLGLAVGMGGMSVSAHAQETAVYVVSYVELLPAHTKEGAALLTSFGAASRKEDGNLRLTVLQERGYANRFAVLEVWRDQAAFAAHGKAAQTLKFREDVRALRISPYDERAYGALFVAAPATPPGTKGLWVLTHVDVVPPRTDDTIALLRPLAADSRKDKGNLLFDIIQQAGRANHFTVVELWRYANSRTAHVTTAHTRQFREELGPMSGALYDARLYEAVE